MEKQLHDRWHPHRFAYLLALLGLLVYLLLCTDAFDRSALRGAVDFSSGWVTDGGSVVDTDTLVAGDFGGSVTISKRLPDTISYHDAFCFLSNNTRVEVRIKGEKVYVFDPAENLTGKGYGTACHTVSLSPRDAGETIEVHISAKFSDRQGGRMWSTYLTTAVNYVRLITLERAFAGFVSALILFLGILMAIIYFCLPNKSALPYDLFALGLALSALGLWSIIDTTLPHLLTGNLHVFRVLDYLLTHFSIYPLACFVTSVTQQRRRIYSRIAFWFSFSCVALMIALRCGAGIDMHRLNVVAYADYLCFFVLIIAILADNWRYCRAKHCETGLRGFAVGAFALIASVIADIVLYLCGVRSVGMHGNFMRVGLCVFAAEMLLQFLRWWSGERTSIVRDRFINHVLQYAVSKDDPEASIRATLEYMGEELGADRVYIFEDMHDGSFANTYEWCREGVAPKAGALQSVPFDGVLDAWYGEFARSHHVLIRDLAAYRSVNEPIYDLFKPFGVERLVAGPMELNGAYAGFLGMDNPPAARMEDIAELIRLLSYFLSQLVHRREEKARLLRHSYCDSLTGARNRRALTEFEASELSPGKPYGYLMCDINGLKAMNDTQGHEAGDALILDTVKCLTEVFGFQNVYRTGGDEFVVYTFPESAEALDADVARVKELLKQKDRSVSIGAVFCAGNDRTLAEVHAEADALMYAEKDRYYQGRNDRRRR